MHRAGLHVVSVLGPGITKKTAATRSLNAAEAAILASAPKEDARDYYYSACSTLAAAIQGLNSQLFTWSTVKLYYSVFYALRAELATRGYCIFYLSSSSFWVHASAGALPSQIRENTHKSVLKIFEVSMPTSALLSQTIGTDAPLEWLMARRENANYGHACFPDPVPLEHFKLFTKYNVRELVAEYVRDKHDRYTFDPDHAMLAFPIKVIGFVRDAISGASLSLTHDEMVHLRKICRDTSGQLSSLLSLMETS